MTMMPTLGEIGSFRFWCQKVLPAVYDDSLSYYELLCKVTAKLNELIEKDNELAVIMGTVLEELEALKDDFEKFKESGFEDYYEAQVDKWISDHLSFIFEHVTSSVFFGLTDDGYFCTWVPYSWRTVEFDTVMDYDDENYGCLVLSY